MPLPTDVLCGALLGVLRLTVAALVLLRDQRRPASGGLSWWATRSRSTTSIS